MRGLGSFKRLIDLSTLIFVILCVEPAIEVIKIVKNVAKNALKKYLLILLLAIELLVR